MLWFDDSAIPSMMRTWASNRGPGHPILLSDMQFHPPGTGGTGSFMDHKLPPLELALKEWQDAFGEAPLVALWNLSSYEGQP